MSFICSENGDLVNLSRINHIGADFDIIPMPRSQYSCLHCDGKPLLCLSFGTFRGFDLATGRTTGRPTSGAKYWVREIRMDLMSYQYHRLIAMISTLAKKKPFFIPTHKGSLSFSTQAAAMPGTCFTYVVFILLTLCTEGTIHSKTRASPQVSAAASVIKPDGERTVLRFSDYGELLYGFPSSY